MDKINFDVYPQDKRKNFFGHMAKILKMQSIRLRRTATAPKDKVDCKMIININSKIFKVFACLLAAFLFFLCVNFGLKAGKNSATGNVVVKNAQAAAAALDFFYSDQSRYPSFLEFQTDSLMKNYFNQYPLASFVSGACPDTYKYQSEGGQNYKFYFCLPSSIQGFNKGWNLIEK